MTLNLSEGPGHFTLIWLEKTTSVLSNGQEEEEEQQQQMNNKTVQLTCTMGCVAPSPNYLKQS